MKMRFISSTRLTALEKALTYAFPTEFSEKKYSFVGRDPRQALPTIFCPSNGLSFQEMRAISEFDAINELKNLLGREKHAIDPRGVMTMSIAASLIIWCDGMTSTRCAKSTDELWACVREFGVKHCQFALSFAMYNPYNLSNRLVPSGIVYVPADVRYEMSRELQEWAIRNPDDPIGAWFTLFDLDSFQDELAREFSPILQTIFPPIDKAYN
jgi:hypothetical protein